MKSDLDIIKELEEEIGFDLPMRRIGEELPNRRGEEDHISYEQTSEALFFGFFVDDGNKVVCLGLDSLDLKKIPSAVLKLRNLKRLSLVKNQITDVSEEIILLSNLENLYLLDNEITEIKPFILDFGLPIEMVFVTDQKCISFADNPIQTPPLEIVNQGNEAIRNYFAGITQAEGKVENLFEAKLLIIGDGGTGKTSFKKRIINPDAEMPMEKDTTLGIDVETWSFPINHAEHGNVEFNVNLWDFGGQKVYRGTHQIFFTDKSYYVLVADTREQGTDFSYWLNTVSQLAGKDSGVLILVNKKFGHTFKFDEKGYRGYFGKIIKEVFELDLKREKGKIVDLQTIVKRHLKELPGIGDPLPPSWVKIREDLLKEEKKFISFDRFREICAVYEITNPSVIRTLSGYFSRIGAFTHYIDDPILQERIYLNSNWLVNTVYKVLDNKIPKEKKGRLDEDDIGEIWETNELNFEINKLTQLMNKFGLMYNIAGTKNYVVPEHLPTDKPYDIWEHEDSEDILHFIYEFDKYMPKGLMSRLIVALNRHIQDHKRVWHRGVNIALKDTHAEIIETYGSANTFQIRIVGTNKIELLAVIRENFARVLEPFRNLNYKQLVPCICDECEIATIPKFHSYYELINLRGKGTGSQCRGSGKLVDVNDLLKITEFVKEEDVEIEEVEPVPYKELKTIELFLASSSELKTDREQVEIWINRENNKLTKKGVFLQLNLWEDFLDAMSKTRLQDEYNKAVVQSEIVICLFATKVGKYTEEEFTVAYNSFKKTGMPKYIFTYFKDVQVNMSTINVEEIISLTNLKNKIKELGHFYTSYNSTEDLTGRLKIQLEKIFADMGDES